MTDRELMQQALEALKFLSCGDEVDEELIKALSERLSQPEQEPVATVTSESGNPNVSMSWWHEPALPVGTKLYTSPPASKPWVGLTDEAVWSLYKNLWMFHPAEEPILAGDILKFARAIEAAHGVVA